MLRARNLICSIATLPLDVFDEENNQIAHPLFSQFDSDVPNVVHLSQTLEDLILDGVAWWEITGFAWDGYPASVRRVDPCLVSLDQPASSRSLSPLPSGIDPRRTYPGSGPVIWIDGRPVPSANLIRFDSPNPGVLVYGAQALRRAILLDRAAKVYAENPDAAEILRIGDEYEDDQAQLFAENYLAAKRKRSTVALPVDVTLERPASANPASIQLVELQRQVNIDIANMMGLDPEELGISTTSRTYANVNDRRRDKINDVLSPYMRAITDRLSMPDVTKRGQVAKFNLSDYLKANDSERWVNYEKAINLGVLSPQEVRDIEGIAGNVPAKPEPPQPDPSTNTDQPVEMPMAATNSRELVPSTFADETPSRFVALNLQSFTVDRESRTIEGLAVPYGSVGNGARFERGALKWDAGQVGRIKLNMDHDGSQTVGVTTFLKDSSEGLRAKFKVARTAEGDRALTLAEDGVYDGLSIEIDPSEASVIPDPRRKSGQLIQSAPLMGVALTPSPAFAEARVSAVKFEKEESNVDNEETPVTETAPETPAPAPAAPAAPAPTEFTRPVVNAARPLPTATQVREPAAYRFNRKGALVQGTHDLSADILAASDARNFDKAAYDRVLTFMKGQFADDPIAASELDDVNPTVHQNRYIDEREYATPLWTRCGRGALPNYGQKFDWPKFSSSGIAMADHVEGTDPFSLDYVATTQTVTPVYKSARVQIPRESWSMGGNPSLSDLIWRKVVRAWNEHREAVIDAALDAQEVSGMTELGTFTAGADGATLGGLLEAGLASLNFARGGFRFDFVATQADLFTTLVGAVDDMGRKLYPIVNPSNANGSTSSRFGSMDIGGVDFVPNIAGAAAGQTAAASSFLIDSTAVDAWASGPDRVDITSSLSYIDIGVWGAMAAAVNDAAGTRHISWDPTA